jgi:WD40 repeat protein
MRFHSKWVLSLSWSPDGKTLASGSTDKKIYIWDREHDKVTTVIEAHTDRVTSVAFSRDGSLLISKSSDGACHVWSAENWDPFRPIGQAGRPLTTSSSVMSSRSRTL